MSRQPASATTTSRFWSECVKQSRRMGHLAANESNDFNFNTNFWFRNVTDDISLL